MRFGYAVVTGRVIGPEGEGRPGTVVFQPIDHDLAGTLDGASVVITHRVVARLDGDGRFVGADGTPGIRIAAPVSLPASARNYLVTLDIPGDPESPRRWKAHIVAGTRVDLADIISGTPTDLLSSPLARPVGDGLLTADAAGIIAIGGGLFSWRD